MDSVSENVQTFTYDYTQNTRTEQNVGDGLASTYYTDSSSEETEITKTTTITTTNSAYITYVKTWFCEQEIK